MISDINPPTDINQKEEVLLVSQKTKEKSKKTVMTNAEKCRNYRQRKKLQVNAVPASEYLFVNGILSQEEKEKSKNTKIKNRTLNN